MADYIQCFGPLIDYESKVLILGSMPGEVSLNEQQYYAHPRNSFWKIVFTLFKEHYTDDYEKKKALLRKHHIALWDVIKQCEREGSLDTAIKAEEPNDFGWLFKTYPNIQAVLFNGVKAHDVFDKKVGFKQEEITFYKLGSTSPARAVSFEKKLAEWQILCTLVQTC